jgi:CheY-like chemotaxis protein
MPYLLIVDDDTDGRAALCQFLQKRGLEVDCVSNGREALAAVLARTPDLMILDLFMPEMDGSSLLEIIRSYLRLQSLPVVVMTGLPDSPLVDRVRHLKVNAILIKGKATFDDILLAVTQEMHRVPPH